MPAGTVSSSNVAFTYDASKPPRTFKELYMDLAERVRASGETGRINILKRYVNIAHMDMYTGRGEKFPWAQRRVRMRSIAEYTTGTVAATLGSASFTGSGTTWDTQDDDANYFRSIDFEKTDTTDVRPGNIDRFTKFLVGGNPEPYLALRVNSDTSVDVDPPWKHDTASGLSYRAVKDIYVLPQDVLHVIAVLDITHDRPIPVLSRKEFRTRNPIVTLAGRPTYCTTWASEIGLGGEISSFDVNDNRRQDYVQFNRGFSSVVDFDVVYTTNRIVVQVTNTGISGTADEYIPNVEWFENDDDEPIMPLFYRHAIVLKALMHYFRDQQDDQRSLEVDQAYTAFISRVIDDNSYGSADRPRLSPRGPGIAAVLAKRPYRRGRRASGRRYDLNGEFDRLED